MCEPFDSGWAGANELTVTSGHVGNMDTMTWLAARRGGASTGDLPLSVAVTVPGFLSTGTDQSRPR